MGKQTLILSHSKKKNNQNTWTTLFGRQIVQNINRLLIHWHEWLWSVSNPFIKASENKMISQRIPAQMEKGVQQRWLLDTSWCLSDPSATREAPVSVLNVSVSWTKGLFTPKPVMENRFSLRRQPYLCLCEKLLACWMKKNDCIWDTVWLMLIQVIDIRFVSLHFLFHL